MKNERTIYYNSYTDDVVVSANQDFKLPENYEWIGKGFGYHFLCVVIYAVAIIFTFFYTKLYWHLKVVGRDKLKETKGKGYFMYANHTQPFGDVFLPAWVNINRRIYTVVSQANYGIPVIGKLLLYLGALPLPEGIKGMKKFNEAISKRISQKKCVIIYPEAHVWPCYTKIRPFGAGAFHYPVNQEAVVYSMTTTYQKRWIGKRPKITIYIDGPFYPNKELRSKEQRQLLCQQVFEAMDNRSKASNYEYYNYIKNQEA